MNRKTIYIGIIILGILSVSLIFTLSAYLVTQAMDPGNGGGPSPPPDPPPDPIPVDLDPPFLQSIAPSPNTDGSVYLHWNVITDADGYELWMSKDGGSWESIATTTSIAFSKTGLTNGNYQFKVRAYNSAGYSAFSSTRSVTVAIPEPDPPPPPIIIPDAPILENIIPNPNINGEINLQWNSVSGATVYTIYRSKDGGSLETLEENIEVNSYTDSVSENGVYSYQVKAGNSEGYSGYSNEESVTVQLTNIPLNPIMNQITYEIINETVEVHLDWDSVICESYNVYRSVNYGDYVLIEENVLSTSYSELLTEGGLHSYRVSAVNQHGESGLSNPMSVNISPEGEPLTYYPMLYILLGTLGVLAIPIVIIFVKMKKNSPKCR